MTETIRFTLDGREVEAQEGETIWQVAARHGVEIPHLCWLPEPGYRADGNCRACMVEIEGERVLAASCIRKPTADMKVHAGSERARTARRMVMELLLADQPPRVRCPRPRQPPLAMGGAPGDRDEPLPDARAVGARPVPPGDGGQSRRLHPVQSLRARLPRGPGQRRHRPRLSRARRENRLRPGRPDGPLDLRRLRRVRAGLPDRGAHAGKARRFRLGPRRPAGRPQRRQRLPLLRRGLPDHLSRPRRRDRLRHRPQRALQREPPLRQGPIRLRLCPSPAAADAAADPQGGHAQGRRRPDRPRRPLDAFPRGLLGGGARGGGPRPRHDPRRPWRAGAGRLRLGQMLERGGLSFPEAGPRRLRHQQCRPLHAALPRLLGGRPDGGHRLRRRHGTLQRGRSTPI